MMIPVAGPLGQSRKDGFKCPFEDLAEKDMSSETSFHQDQEIPRSTCFATMI